MKLLTAGQMREVDRKTIQEIGVPGIVLMENAGIHVTQILEEHFETLEALRIAIICGCGNNGGDGFVVARQLYMRGILPDVFVLCAEDKIRGNAATNLNIIKNFPELPVIMVPDERTYKRMGISFDSYQVVVDAILGTGLHQPAEGYFARVIEDINRSPASVLSVDIPSGLFADEYRPVETAVYADITVTFTTPKPGLILGDSYAFVGTMYTVNIGTPDSLLHIDDHYLNLTEDEDLKPFFMPRKRDTHKGNYGHLLVVGGARGKTGAAKMTGMAALRSGAGLVTVALPERYMGQVISDCAELMTEPLAADEEGFLTAAALPGAVELLRQRDLLVLGPGLGAGPQSVEFVQGLVPQLDVPVIIDADALNCVAEDTAVLNKLTVPAVLTPHPGEMARLMHCTTGEVQENREEVAREFSQNFGVYLILKGYRTVFAEPSGQVWINPTGNSGMATAGTGDVLSGILGAFCARINHQNRDAWILAAVAATYLHGLAGDLAAEAFTEEALVARDLINFIHTGIQQIRES
ncbi:MAG: NAD(P)H-hydrate dehydratase [Acidobacteria bacterium]|nr:NAD(P)H-hydrate dehydratase [Acidobacteriota bacterium]